MNIFSIDGIFYRIGTWLYNFMYLNILFIICCIPIITIYPAFAALFGVVRQWRNNKDVAIFSQFKEMFIENWRQSYLVGILFTIIFSFIAFDFMFLYQINSSYKVVISIALILFSFLAILSFLSIYPLMVHMNTTFKQLCISSLKIGIYKLHLTLFCMLIVGAWTILSLRFALLIPFFFFSVSAYIIYWMADLKFKKVLPQEDPVSE